jgi:hypothetical protein
MTATATGPSARGAAARHPARARGSGVLRHVARCGVHTVWPPGRAPGR